MAKHSKPAKKGGKPAASTNGRAANVKPPKRISRERSSLDASIPSGSMAPPVPK